MNGLSSEGCAQRREYLLANADADYLIITNPRHIFYLTGAYITPLALSGWGANFLTIDGRTGHSRLIVHNFIGTPPNTYVDSIETWRWYDSATDPGTDPYRAAIPELNKRLPDLSGRRSGIEVGWLPAGVNIGAWSDLTSVLSDMQRRKMPDELLLIREAIQVAAAGQRAARTAIQPGATELDVYNAICAGSVAQAGYPILPLGDFVSGERTGGGGGAPTDRVLRAGDLMIVDYFPIVNGYRGDITATVAVPDRGAAVLPEEYRVLDRGLHAAQAAGERLLRPGSIAGDVYRAVRDTLAEHGLAAGFSHHAGHGLGLGHPEAPYFVPNSTEVLVAGDVVTLEPGSYVQSADRAYGARIEHDYLITETGFERLSDHVTAFI